MGQSVRVAALQRRWKKRFLTRIAFVLLGLQAWSGLSSGQTIAGQTISVQDSPFLGSVRIGQATGDVLSLSLEEALDRALKHNLGVIEGEQNVRESRAERLRSLNALLPDLSGSVSGTQQKINLEALGFSGFSADIPGLSIPSVVSFSVADARVSLSQQVFNWSDIKRWRSAKESERASALALKSDRDLVVLTAGNAYLVVISDHANVDSITTQVKTAQTLHDRAVDQNKAGVIAGIDVLRARVELQTQQQRLIAAQNQLAIDKLMLARIVGIPKGQSFEVSDSVPYAPLDGVIVEDALQRAYTTRPDYLGVQAEVRAAELARQSASAQNYPSVSADANFGAIGSPDFGAARGTYSVGATLTVPIFQGTRVRANTLQADALLQQRRAELADLDGRIHDEVHTAFLNLRSSADLVRVSESNIDLANQTLTQAQDRFSAGVADNLEVVQAQESVATANQSYIGSLYAYNLAKISLARAIGIAEQSALQYLGAK